MLINQQKTSPFPPTLPNFEHDPPYQLWGLALFANHFNLRYIMANQTSAANAALTLNTSYNVSVTGFTYIKEWAAIKGKIVETGDAVTVILGDKLNFGMRDMFELKQSNGIRAKYTKDKIINGVTYKQFQLEEILF